MAIARASLSTTPFPQQVDKILGQVVMVVLGQSHGSGFYISDTLLLTNQHVVGLSQYVKVKLKSGKEVVGEVLSRDAGRDVALIKTESIGAHGLPVRTEDPGIGSQVYVVGSPLDLGESVSAGIVSGFKMLRNYRFIQSEANVQHGNSGGPIFDDKGNVIGLTDLGIPADDGTASGIGMFIPIGDALKTLNVTFAGE
jgi:S1-C subfamily serine protease